MKIKTIAMYLPQFHHVQENDEWWGEGFTEWKAVRDASKLVEGQVQPRKPLNENYYDLMDKKTMQWQAELAEKYDVYGFCFYHYWFKDGRRILERPAENLLEWVDINMRFCFSWANETWARTWSKLTSKNTWLCEDRREDADDNGILLEQKYGAENNWKKHYDYLKKFFSDSRYIRIDDKPVFMIYKPDEIECLNQMLGCWNRWAKEDGFKGIYIILSNTSKDSLGQADAQLYHEPARTIGVKWCEGIEKDNINGVNVLDYDKVWKAILSRRNISLDKVYYGGFVNYDDTPRRSRGGTFLKNMNAGSFEKYFRVLVQKNLQKGNEYLFLNAWNEWGEGMYLEPDEENQYGFLEAIHKVVNEPLDVKFDLAETQDLDNISEQYEKKILELEKRYQKFKDYYEILNKWLILKEEGKSVKNYFNKEKYVKIGIYGMGVMGKHLLEEFKNDLNYTIYGIDRHADTIHVEVPVIGVCADCANFDIIVVTATFDFDNIYGELRKHCTCPIISLKQVMDECE